MHQEINPKALKSFHAEVFQIRQPFGRKMYNRLNAILIFIELSRHLGFWNYLVT